MKSIPTSFPSTKSLFINILTLSLVCSACLCKIHVDISNHLPVGSPPLTVRCQSGDDDLGYHELYPNQPSYTWAFRPDWWLGTTLFFCHFWWDGKDAVFDVYNEDWGTTYCARFKTVGPSWSPITEELSNTCYWQVMSDGIYLSRTIDPFSSEGSWVQTHKWGDR